MKVNFNNTQNYVYAYKLMVGSTFTAKRSGYTSKLIKEAVFFQSVIEKM